MARLLFIYVYFWMWTKIWKILRLELACFTASFSTSHHFSLLLKINVRQAIIACRENPLISKFSNLIIWQKPIKEPVKMYSKAGYCPWAVS